MLLISHISKYTHGLSFSVTLLNFTLCELNSELLLITLLYKHTHHCEYTRDGSMYFWGGFKRRNSFTQAIKTLGAYFILISIRCLKTSFSY